MWQRRFTPVATALALTFMVMAATVSPAGAYAEEPLPFRNPHTGRADQSVEVSTIHTDITYVLALAAGFSETDSETLAIYNQLVDTNHIATAGATYTNCTGTFPPRLAPCAGKSDPPFWPRWGDPSWQPGDQAAGTSCVTSRYGPFEGFFHFPHRTGPNAWEIASLRDWGWGYTEELKAYEGYVWGDLHIATGFFGDACFKLQPVVVETGMQAGSLQAFATYLHSLADSYSHEECQAQTDRLGWGWPTHTSPYATPHIYECNYVPTEYLVNVGDSHHGREFGSEWIASDSHRTDLAIQAVYDELVARGEVLKVPYRAVKMDTRLSGRFHKLTLHDALYYFVHHWNFDEPAARRAYAKQLAAEIVALRGG